MAASSSISILTLHDTPLSLKPNYRHHLVNSLWTLKSLDNYVISDEEIIEDSSFGGRFAPLRSSFYINCSCSLTKVRKTLYLVSGLALNRITWPQLHQINKIKLFFQNQLVLTLWSLKGHLKLFISSTKQKTSWSDLIKSFESSHKTDVTLSLVHNKSVTYFCKVKLLWIILMFSIFLYCLAWW